jgi:hypothetical protein
MVRYDTLVMADGEEDWTLEAQHATVLVVDIIRN